MLACRTASFLVRTRTNVAFAITTLAGITADSHAQWLVTNLGGGSATGVDGDHQVGFVELGGTAVREHAVLWNGSAASVLDIHKDLLVSGGTSKALGISGAHQVGFVTGDPEVGPGGRLPRAVIWRGSSDSMVLLDPLLPSPGGGFGYSAALAVSGTEQAGVVNARAGIWRGTADSWLEIHPEGASASIAHATNGTQQAGAAHFGGAARAAMWSGSTASWVDLHPTGADSSTATAIATTQQAGYATFDGARHAGIWSGSAASWQDLHPPGATASEILGMVDVAQVGVATFGGVAHASIWYGSAASWVDLGAFLPSNMPFSEATGIWTDGSTLRVVGNGYAINEGAWAVLWTGTVPEPGAALIVSVFGASVRRRAPSRRRRISRRGAFPLH